MCEVDCTLLKRADVKSGEIWGALACIAALVVSVPFLKDVARSTVAMLPARRPFDIDVAAHILYGFTLSAMSFFAACAVVLALRTCSASFKRKFSALTWMQKLDVMEKVPSTVHAIVLIYYGLKTIVMDGEYTHGDAAFTAFPAAAQKEFAFSIGYVMWDCSVMLVQGDTDVSMWVHHAAVAMAQTASLLGGCMSFTSQSISVMEATVIPGNMLFYVRCFGKDRKALHNALVHARLASFLVVRIGHTFAYPAFLMVTMGRRVFSGVVPTPLVLVVAGCVLPFVVLNIYWTRIMILSLLRKRAGACPTVLPASTDPADSDGTAKDGSSFVKPAPGCGDGHARILRQTLSTKLAGSAVSARPVREVKMLRLASARAAIRRCSADARLYARKLSQEVVSACEQDACPLAVSA